MQRPDLLFFPFLPLRFLLHLFPYSPMVWFLWDVFFLDLWELDVFVLLV